MRCLAVCHTELVARLVEAVLAPYADVELMVESAAFARRVDDFGLPTTVADPQRLDSFVRADLTPEETLRIAILSARLGYVWA